MRGENKYREGWVDYLVHASPDGLIHTAAPIAKKPRKRTGPAPYGNAEEIRFCLNCKLPRCVLDNERRCGRLMRFRALQNKRKEKGKNDEGDQ